MRFSFRNLIQERLETLTGDVYIPTIQSKVSVLEDTCFLSYSPHLSEVLLRYFKHFLDHDGFLNPIHSALFFLGIMKNYISD